MTETVSTRRHQNVTLICGLNGVGKSTFAKALAKEINYRFVDIEDIYFSKQDNPDYPALKNPDLTRMWYRCLLILQAKKKTSF